MPSFRHTAVSAAPPEEVWKLLYDPARYPEWWSGIAAVEDAPGGFSYYPEGSPDTPKLQRLETSSEERRIVVSCLVHDFRFEWRLEALEGGAATRIGVEVDVPDAEATSFDAVRDAIGRSIVSLAGLAATV